MFQDKHTYTPSLDFSADYGAQPRLSMFEINSHQGLLCCCYVVAVTLSTSIIFFDLSFKYLNQ